MPGCGKTVLSATIFDNLEEMNKCTTLTFFFDFTDTRKQKLDDVLRSLAFQLYCLWPDSQKVLDNLFASHQDGQKQPDSDRLSSCLNDMMQTVKKITLLLDALDECSERPELLKWMKEFIPPLTNVQLVSTSRPEDDIKHNFRHWSGDIKCIPLNKEPVNADIRSYINARLHNGEEFKRWTKLPEVLEKIENTVSSKADGM